MLISVHLPKTGGSSVLSAISKHFEGRLLKDYADYPVNTPSLKRNVRAAFNNIVNQQVLDQNYSCIHGHFLPLKYRFFRSKYQVRFVTWLRDPVERLASHYYYWIKEYEPGNSQTLRNRVVEEEWSLEKFCFSPELRNIYSQFLWGFPLGRFNFIGISEHFESEFTRFTQDFLGGALPALRENVNQNKINEKYIEDDNLRNKIEIYHAKDMLLYKEALSMRARIVN